MKVQFRTGKYGWFVIMPTILITYSKYSPFSWKTGFAIEIAWGKWGIGFRFYK